MNPKRIILAGVAINFISFIVGGGSYLLFGWVFGLEPTNIWKWTPAMGFDIPVNWPTLFLLNIILAMAFAWVFALLYKGIPGQGIRKGLVFGFFAWIIGVLPATTTLYLMTNIAPLALTYFTIQGLLEWLVYGAVIAAIYREYYQCPACGFRYREKEWADKCEAWCKTHQSCNLEITAHGALPQNTNIR